MATNADSFAAVTRAGVIASPPVTGVIPSLPATGADTTDLPLGGICALALLIGGIVLATRHTRADSGRESA